MYEDFFGLREKPFMLTPDADLFFPSREHSKALNILEYGLQGQATFVAITGEVGTGKTTLVRRFVSSLDAATSVGIITNTHPSLGDLLQWVLLAFELEYKNKDEVELYETFVDFLIAEYAANRRVMLIIDEAQNMTVETLEQLRMLSNVNLRKDLVLQIVLVGQPELLDTLKQPHLRQLAQRISADYHLTPLECRETMDYIRHRIEAVGGRRDLFEDVAAGAVHYFTRGVPRLINIVCDHALLFAFAEERETVDLDTIVSVIKEKQSSGLGVFPDIPAETDIEKIYTEVATLMGDTKIVDLRHKRPTRTTDGF